MRRLFSALFLLTATASFAQQPGFIPNKYGQSYGDNAPLRFGNDLDALFEFDTAQTIDSLLLGLSSSNSLLITEKADMAFDFSHAGQTNPTLFVHSRNQNTDQWISISHDGTNGVIDVGVGKVTFPGGVAAGSGDITAANVAATGTIRSSNTTSIGWSVVAGANTACSTTCTNACVFGQNTADMSIVDCAAATADVCVCAGAN